MASYYIDEYYPHANQLKLHKSKAKEVVVVSSIRAGKSFGIIHDVITKAWNDKSGFGTLVAAPTYKLVEVVLEREITRKIYSMGLLKSHSFSRHESELMNGNKIYYRSLEDSDISLRGLNIARAYVDEASYTSKYAIDVLKGRLLTTNGQLFLIATPAGLNNWIYEDYFAKGHKPGVDYIKFNLLDNPIITSEAVNRLKESYDELLYRQEVLGEWVSLFANQVYYSFSEDNVKLSQYIPGQQVYVGLDFNIDINAWVAVQKDSNNTFRVIKEGYGAKTTNDVAKEILKEFGSDVIVIPDATGQNRVQGVAVTQYQLLRQAGVGKIVENRSNPKRQERFAITNAALTNALGEHRITIDDSCRRLIKELRELSYKEGSEKVDDDGGKKGHITDALGYVIYYLSGGNVGSVNNNKQDFVSTFKAQKRAYDTFTL